MKIPYYDSEKNATQQVKIRPLQPDRKTFSVNVLNRYNFIPVSLKKGEIIGYCQILMSRKKSLMPV